MTQSKFEAIEVENPTPSRTPGPEPANTVLEDLVDACVNYAVNHLNIEIFDVDPIDGNAINRGEEVIMQVRVSNGGPLHVTDLTVLIEGLNGTQVKKHGDASFTHSVTSSVFDTVPAHQASSFVVAPEDYHFQVGGPAGGEKDLVRVSIKDHNVDLLHPTEGHTDPAPAANAVYRAEHPGGVTAPSRHTGCRVARCAEAAQATVSRRLTWVHRSDCGACSRRRSPFRWPAGDTLGT